MRPLCAVRLLGGGPVGRLLPPSRPCGAALSTSLLLPGILGAALFGSLLAPGGVFPRAGRAVLAARHAQLGHEAGAQPGDGRQAIGVARERRELAPAVRVGDGAE